MAWGSSAGEGYQNVPVWVTGGCSMSLLELFLGSSRFQRESVRLCVCKSHFPSISNPKLCCTHWMHPSHDVHDDPCLTCRIFHAQSLASPSEGPPMEGDVKAEPKIHRSSEFVSAHLECVQCLMPCRSVLYVDSQSCPLKGSDKTNLWKITSLSIPFPSLGRRPLLAAHD